MASCEEFIFFEGLKKNKKTKKVKNVDKKAFLSKVLGKQLRTF
jgi:hypothetical protein